jgi:hypothetical protein
MKNTEFAGVAGKVVEKILFQDPKSNQGKAIIEIMFQDKTTLYLEMRAKIALAPDLVSWKTGEYRTIRHYLSVTA